MLGKLDCLVDHCVHLQQLEHLLEQLSSRVNKEFWVLDRVDTDKDILRAGAHKLLSSVFERSPSGVGSRPAGCESSHSRSTQSKHNKKRR